MAERSVRVLSIDGGGIRGIIPAVVLEHIEAQTGRPIASLFDLIVGTSTGGIMALLLTVPGRDGRPRYTATEVRELYTQHGRDLFSKPEGYGAGQPPGTYPRYPAQGVADTLRRYFDDAVLGQAITGVLVSAYDIGQQQPRFFLGPDQAKHGEDYYMRDVAQATSAFPGMFPPVHIVSVDGSTTLHVIDGGMTSANPAGLAAIATREAFAVDAPHHLLSLGTGECSIPLPWEQVTRWGFAQWADQGRLVDLLFRGASQSANIQAAGEDNLDYVRLQVELPPDRASTDDISDGNVQGLLDIARAEITTPRRRADRDRFSGWPDALAYEIRVLAQVAR